MECETTPADRAQYRHQVHFGIRDLISRWNETAQVLHHGHIIDLSAILTEAIIHPNSLISAKKQCSFSELPRLLPPCPHGFRSAETCPTCLHFQKVREQT